MKKMPYNEDFIRPERVEIRAKGVKQSYRFLHISDVHVAVAREDEPEADRALAEKRTKAWSLGVLTSNESFEEMLKYVRHVRPDALLIAGDAVDYIGEANAALIKNAIGDLNAEGIKTLYAYGNHEGASYTETIPDYRAYYYLYPDVMGGDPSFQVMDLGDLIIVAVEDSMRDITESQLERIKSLCREADGRGISIILLMHIPIFCEDIAPRVLKVWGPSFMIGSLAEDSPTVHEFCELIKSESSPIAAVLAGHIHFSQKGSLSHGRMQYVSAPAFEGFVYDVTVKGE